MGKWYQRHHIIPEGANLRQLTDELVKPVSKPQSLPRNLIRGWFPERGAERVENFQWKFLAKSQLAGSVKESAGWRRLAGGWRQLAEKKPERKRKNLIRLGVEKGKAYAWSRTRMGGWAVAQSSILNTTVTLSRIRRVGYESMLSYYQKTQPQI